jgi:predicted nucleic acid-binding protein
MYFTLSFFILSLPIQDGPLFDKLYNVTAPVTHEIVSYIKRKIGTTTSELQEVGEKAFSNTRDIPKTVDEVSSELSSNVKKEIEKHDEYTVEERESLLRVLQNSD